jgi:MerR family transcriptional regulator, redox-sensitive transcriptional activator SoxR
MNDATLTIGEVAQLVGLRTSAIRYYESVGVLPEPERESGQRRYTTKTVRQLQVIDVAKRAGFSLEEARALLATDREGSPAYAQLRELAQQKLPQVDALIERAQAMRAWLTTATGCGCQTLDACALFDADSDRQRALGAHSDAMPALTITHVG